MLRFKDVPFYPMLDQQAFLNQVWMIGDKYALAV